MSKYYDKFTLHEFLNNMTAARLKRDNAVKDYILTQRKPSVSFDEISKAEDYMNECEKERIFLIENY